MKESIAQMKQQLIVGIEERLGWGTGDSWTNKDFKILSEKILESTGKQLSITTLKRIWGRAETIANTSVTTLDILSEFLGYENWRDFRQSHNSPVQIAGRPKISAKFFVLGAGTLLVLFLSLFFLDNKEMRQEQPKVQTGSLVADSVLFSYDKVTTGYPNTVIFRYDVGDLAYDSLCIQQYWDRSKRIALDDSQGLVTSTYYLPGYFLAKLVANDQILRERDLYIPTSGWQGALLGENDELTYLKDEIRVNGEVLRLDFGVLNSLNDLKDSQLYLANLSPEPVIDGSNFRMVTSFRMPNASDASICQYIRMTVTGTREVISLAFSVPGCVGDLNFYIDKEMVTGSKNDFSSFGRTADEWTQCKLEVEQGRLRVFINDQEAFSQELKVDLGKIGGLQWYFDGLGEIQELNLEDDQYQFDLIN